MKAKHIVPEKFCEQCGIRLARKRYNGRLEDRAMFLRRRFCSRECAWVHSRKPSVTLSGLRCRAAKKRGRICQLCRGKKNLNIHHINRDVADNSPSNLLTLCASCHTALHWKEGKQARRRGACTVKNCSVLHTGRGYCMKHYQRFKKYGDPLLTKRSGRSGPISRQPMRDTQESMNFEVWATASCPPRPNWPLEPSTKD